MTPHIQHADILDERESLRGPFFKSVLLHAALAGLFIVSSISFQRSHETWGSTSTSSGDAVAVNAVKSMSIGDALGILRGPDTAATSYLKKTTTPDLTRAFKPVIDSSLKKTDATRYWKDVFETYNKLPTTFKKVDTDLSSYATQKAMDGIFYYVAVEEKNIRKDPAAQVTDILKKVFGGK